MKKLYENIRKYMSIEYIKGLSRNAKLALSLVGVLLIVGGASLAFGGSQSVEITESSTEVVEEIETAEIINAEITYIEGVVEYQPAATPEMNEDSDTTSMSESDWETASEGQTIAPGDKVRTVGAVSKAVLALDNETETRLDASSQIEALSLTEERVVYKQESGYVFSRVKDSSDQKYVIETKNAQFQAKGTAFMTITTGDEEAVEVYHNEVEEVITNRPAKSGEKIKIETVNTEVSSTLEDLDVELVKTNEFIQWNRSRDADNESFKDKLGFLNDFDGPELSITDPKSSSTVSIDPAENQTITISGKTDASATLTVQSKSVQGQDAVDVRVEDDGSFVTPALPVSVGNSVFEFIAKDRTGNKTELNVSYTIARKTATQNSGIALTVNETEDKVELKWGLIGLTTPDGVKVLFSEASNPKFPDSSSIYEKKNQSASFKKSELGDGKTYYFKVCRFNEDKNTCDSYSNEVTVTIPESESDEDTPADE